MHVSANVLRRISAITILKPDKRCSVDGSPKDSGKIQYVSRPNNFYQCGTPRLRNDHSFAMPSMKSHHRRLLVTPDTEPPPSIWGLGHRVSHESIAYNFSVGDASMAASRSMHLRMSKLVHRSDFKPHIGSYGTETISEPKSYVSITVQGSARCLYFLGKQKTVGLRAYARKSETPRRIHVPLECRMYRSRPVSALYVL